ncbi:alpha/beta hydrolase [Nocardioides sp. LHD-245]|uniref:alpha/beta fold hydrolase n=1 Tax=Nocardioides sp. LHD-245 TaxID=3051387 RepID=UPI0027E2085C|nr:alpha/beta hydrolase [Nocardioides sp. LHD-245]
MRVPVNGVHLYFDVEGAGLVPDGPAMRERETLVLVHGGPSSDHAVFKPHMSTFAEDAQVIYYDHRGHGRSDIGQAEDWTLAQWGADLAGLLDALEIERPYVLGASFGGFVAQSFATQFPDRVAKLALVSTAARSDNTLSAEMFARLGGPEVGEVARAWLEQDEGADQEEFLSRCLPYYTVEELDVEALGRSVERPYLRDHFFGKGGEWHTFDLTGHLQQLTCPTLVLHGALDPILPVSLAQEMHAAIRPDLARLHVVQNAGHGWGDQQDEWLSTLREFFFAEPNR